MGVTATSIKLGTIMLLSSTLGQVISGSTLKNLDAAIRGINSRGGVDGRMLQLDVCDDGGDVTRATACYEKLTQQDKVFALDVGETFATDVIHEQLDRDQIPWFTWGWFQSEWQDPWMFPCHANGMHEAHAAAQWAADNVHPKTVAIGYLNVSEDINAKNELVKVFQKNGIKVSLTFSQEEDSPDESQHVLAVRAANPDMVVFFSWPVAIAKFFNDASAQSYGPPLGYIGNHLFGDPMYGDVYGKYIEGKLHAITSYLGPQEHTPTMQQYHQEVTRYEGTEQAGLHAKYTLGHHISQAAYVCTQIFAKAAAELGANLTRQGLKHVLESQSWDTGMGITLKWPAGDHGRAPYAFGREYMYKWIQGSDGGFDFAREPDAIDKWDEVT